MLKSLLEVKLRLYVNFQRVHTLYNGAHGIEQVWLWWWLFVSIKTQNYWFPN